MPEWLEEAMKTSPEHPELLGLVLRTSLAVFMGFLVACVYGISLGARNAKSASLATALVLLSALVAVVTMVISDSVARAFGLVGALSIVRFRTVVEDTRETAFVIFAVVVGMAIGVRYDVLAVVAVVVVGSAAILLCRLPMLSYSAVAPAKLVVRIGLGVDPMAMILPVLSKYSLTATLKGSATARQGAALDLTYSVRGKSPEDLLHAVAELNRVEGVQSAEWSFD